MLFASSSYAIYLLAIFFMFVVLRARTPVALLARALLLLVLGDIVYLLLSRNVHSLWDPVGGLLMTGLGADGDALRSPVAYGIGAVLFVATTLGGWFGAAALERPRARAAIAAGSAFVLVVAAVVLPLCVHTGHLDELSAALASGGHLIYLAFLGLAIGAALSPQGRVLGRMLILFLVSAIFYHAWAAGMVGAYRYLLLLILGTIVLDFYLALWLSRMQTESGRRVLLLISLVSNLGALALFKYFDFFISSANTGAGWLGYELTVKPFALILPAGISFHTFQSLSYTIDVYRRRIEPTHSVVHFATFVLFFPQLVAGPIVRAEQFMPQLEREPLVDAAWANRAARGMFRIMLGLFKKLALADFLARLHTDRVFAEPSLFSGLEVLMAVYGYAFQIYLDFSAYSDIAIGSGTLLGYDFPENFRTPYRSANLQEFWRRWHMTLSTWLRDYLYIPLGGSRRHTYRNLAITMLLGGLWHGGSWNFVLWGALHGGGLGVTRVFQRMAERQPARALKVALGALAGGILLLGLHLVLSAQLTRLGSALPVGPFWIHVLLAWLYLTPGWAAVTAWLSLERADAGADAVSDEAAAAAEHERAGLPASPQLGFVATALRMAFLSVTVVGLWAVHEGHREAWMALLAGWMLLACAADVADHQPSFDVGLRWLGRAVRRATAIVLTFNYVCFAWVFFRATTLDGARAVFTQIAGGATDAVNLSAPFLLVLATAACAHWFPPGTYRWLRERFVWLHPVARGVVLAAGALALRELSSPIVVPFIYFQF